LVWGSGLSLKHNNSFKSILKYFKSKNINFDDDWRIFSKNLYILHKDNPQNIKIIEEFIHQNINNYLKWGEL
jgi:5-bromo-4-chloroindolyl phosphate hydrolysis protein